MPLPPMNIDQRVHYPGLKVSGLPVTPHAKRGYEQNPVPSNCEALIPCRANPYPFQTTDISARGILPVSPVPVQFLATTQMTGQSVAAVYCGNQPVIPLPQQQPISMNTLPWPIEPDTYIAACHPFSGQNFMSVPADQMPGWPPSCPVESRTHDRALRQGFESKAAQPEATMVKAAREIAITTKVNLDPEANEFLPKTLQCSHEQASRRDDRQSANAFAISNEKACPSQQLPAKDEVPVGAIPLPQVAGPESNEAGAELTPSSAPDYPNSPGTYFSVQQVLQLRHPGAARKTPWALRLLYLECFDFHQKIRTDNSFDKQGNRIKLSRSELKKQHKTLQNQLRENNSTVKLPPLHKIKKLPSTDILLTRPTSYVDIHPLSSQLNRTAASLDPDKFIKREKVRNSLAAHLAFYKCSGKEMNQLKEMAKTKEARGYVEKLETDDLWNLDFTSMYYYPYFDQKVFTLKAPFIRSAETIYCHPRLSSQPLLQHGKKLFAISEKQQAINESHDKQLADIINTIMSLAKTLSIKLNQQADNNTPAKVPETFSGQCIQWHIQFTSDLVYKMIKLGEENTQDIGDTIAYSMDALLVSINTLSDYSSKFTDEFIMLTESLCLLLQSRPLQHLLVQQEAQGPGNVKSIWLKSIEQLESTTLMILVKSLQHPGLLNTTMCLLKTLSDHEIFRTGQAGNNKISMIRLARVATEITNSLLTTLTNNFPDDLSTHNQFIQNLNSCCSILNQVHQKVIQKSNLVHTESQNLEASIKTLHEAGKIRLTEIDKVRQDYLNEFESEKNINHDILRENMKKREQTKQKQETRNKRKQQLQQEITRIKSEPQEKEQPESDHAKLVNSMSKRLQLFNKNLEYGENYVNELTTVDSVFPEILQSPVLAVWVYGDLAYNLCNKCTDKFNRATLFVEKFDKMRAFCDDALQEAAQHPWQYDAQWLYDRNPNQPISISSINFLTRLSDPEQIQVLIKRAFTSASLYQSALDRGRDAAHQLTQDMMVGLASEENDLQMFHLQQRVAFIIEEMNDVKQYLKDLQPVPDISNLLATRKQLFKTLKTKEVTSVPDGGKADQNKEAKNTVYKALLKKSKREWKVDSSVCDMRNYAEQQLEQVIKGFTELKTQLGAVQ